MLSLPEPMRRLTAPERGSMRVTTPVRISCSLELNSSYIMPRSASRMPWMITWRAVWAAMRPKLRGLTSMRSTSPSWAWGREARASSRLISVQGLSTTSTTSFLTNMRTEPFSSSASTVTLSPTPSWSRL